MLIKKIAIYVEGQTEQLLLNHLILTWWSFSGVQIDNIKLVNDLKNPVPDFKSQDPLIQFVIINVEGVGSLISAIAEHGNTQSEMGFEIIGLRDLDDNDSTTTEEAIIVISQHFKEALKVKRVYNHKTIELFFAVKKIEAWMLAFTEALSKWAKISENDVVKQIQNKIPNYKLEEINNPANLLKSIGYDRGKNPKSYHEIKSFVSNIAYSSIQKVYDSNSIPNFNKFWDKMVSFDNSL